MSFFYVDFYESGRGVTFISIVWVNMRRKLFVGENFFSLSWVVIGKKILVEEKNYLRRKILGWIENLRA